MTEPDALVRAAIGSSYYDDPIDTQELLETIRLRTGARRHPVRWAAMAASAAAVLVIGVTMSRQPLKPGSAATGGRPAQAPRLTAAASRSASATQDAPAAGDRAFPLTPMWLPYGLSVERSYLSAAGGVVLWIQRSKTDVSGPAVQVTIADSTALSSIDHWEHFSTSAVTVNGLPATAALSHGSRAGEAYLLFQRSPGNWVLISAHQAQGTPADPTTLRTIAEHIVATPLTAHAPSPS
jgi:hypothetical protein